jgi:Flp pilus assembly pilin Flp
MPIWKKLWLGDEAQDLTEYVLLLAFIALTTTALVLAPVSAVNAIWVNGNSQLTTAGSVAGS